jgi:hypothetical protein
MVFAVVLIPFAAWYVWRRPDPSGRLMRSGAAAALTLAGIAIALTPQVLINTHVHDKFSPFPAWNKDLSLLQLSAGLHWQKYETLVTPRPPLPASVYFNDPATRSVLDERGETGVDSWGEYIGIAAEHPVTLGAGYFRRAFNGYDVQYTTPYIADLKEQRSVPRSWLLYTVLFLALLTFAVRARRRAIGRSDWALAALFVLPGLGAIVGAIEPRFFLPVTFAVFAVVCFVPGWRAAWAGTGWAQRITLAVVYVAFILGCFSLAADTYSLMDDSPDPVDPHPLGQNP